MRRCEYGNPNFTPISIFFQKSLGVRPRKIKTWLFCSIFFLFSKDSKLRPQETACEWPSAKREWTRLNVIDFFSNFFSVFRALSRIYGRNLKFARKLRTGKTRQS